MATDDVWKLETGSRNVTLYSAHRMPHSSRKGAMDSARKALRTAIQCLCPSPGEILEGVYSSQIDGFFDIENVVYYNVETATFRIPAQHGLRARRCRAHSEALTPGFAHRMDYRFVSKPGIPENPLVHLQFDPVGFRNVFDIWWAASNGKATNAGAVSRKFGLYVELGNQHRNPAAKMKILLDGIISALQQDFAPDPVAVSRLSQKHRVGSALIERRLADPILHTIPQSRRTRLVRPFGAGVQWHPADDLCEEWTIALTDEDRPDCNAYIYALPELSG